MAHAGAAIGMSGSSLENYWFMFLLVGPLHVNSSDIVGGAAPAADTALVTAGGEFKWLNGFSVAASFEGEFSRVTESYAGKGTLRYSW
jgi:hypothetical protein